MRQALVTGQSFDREFGAQHQIHRLQVELRGSRYVWTISVRAPGLSTGERQELEHLCQQRVDEANAERGQLNPRDKEVRTSTVEWLQNGTLETKRESTGMSVTAFANVFRRLAKPAGAHLPAVVHAWPMAATLQATLTPLIGDYPVDEVRRMVTRYNVLVEHVSDWQDAQNAVNGHAIQDHLTKDRKEMAELWTQILGHDRQLIANMKPHVDKAHHKDMPARALQLYENAVERVAQGGPTKSQESKRSELQLDPKSAAAQHMSTRLHELPVFTTMPVLAPRAETMATCACSLADLGESLRDKTVGQS